jgi:hypothetical protein
MVSLMSRRILDDKGKPKDVKHDGHYGQVQGVPLKNPGKLSGFFEAPDVTYSYINQCFTRVEYPNAT